MRIVTSQFFLLIAPFLTTSALGQNPVLTYHNDNLRTGWDYRERLLTLQNVNPATFGKLFSLPADGKVDAEPLYVPALNVAGGTHNVVFVATEHDSVYAYDADSSGAPLWQITMLKSGETTSDNRGCDQVTPEIGVTATPAIDLTVGPHGTMYVAAMSKDSSGQYHQRLHALDLTTGAEEFNGPVDVAATYPGSGQGSSNGVMTFDPAQYKERPGLLIVNGTIVTVWSSHCDFAPYSGWIMTYSEASLQQVSVFNFTPNGSEGCVWQSGGGAAADASGNIYFLAANGTFDTTLNSSGFPNQGDYGNAFVKIGTSGTQMAVSDYFTMSNTTDESSADQDLGSGGAILLPDVRDASGNVRQLAAGLGKDSNIYIVDRTNMGKFSPTSNNIYQELPGAISGGAWSVGAYFDGALFFGGVNDYIRVFALQNGQFVAAGKTPEAFGYPGASPSVSSDLGRNAILWAAENVNPAVLHAFNARNLSTELYNSNQSGTRDQFGAGNKFITPMIANGKVYVGTTNSVGVFGLF